MIAQALLKDLQNRNIQLKLVDNELKARAAKGVITQEIRVLLAEHKAELIALLCATVSPVPMDASDASPDMDPQIPDLSREDVETRFTVCPLGIAPVVPLESAEPLASVETPASAETPASDVPPASDPFDQLSDVCSQCGAELEYYSDQGVAYCELHRFQASQQQCQASPSLALVTQKAFFEQDIAMIGEQLRASSGPIALDLETTGLSPQQHRVVSISLGIPGRVFVLDMRPYYALSPERQAAWRLALVRLFDERADVTWIGHNIKFDWSFLAVHFGVRLRRVYDTMLVEQVLQAGRETPSGFYTLRETAERYGLKVSKQQRNWFVDLDTRPTQWAGPFPQDQLVYMVQDIEVPYRLADMQKPHLTHHELERVAQLENEAVPALASMEVHGVLIDKELWQRILKDKRAQQEAIEQELVETIGVALQAGRERMSLAQIKQYESHQSDRAAENKRLAQEYYTSDKARGKSGWGSFQAAGLKAWDAMHPEPLKPRTTSRPIKLSSPWQVREALGYMGIQVESTEEEVLEAYTRQYPIVERFLAWRKLNHFCHSFGNNVLAHIKADGRIHATFSQVTAVSGRIICRDPNLQQIPKQHGQASEGEDVRRCFIAPQGSCLLTADLSNIELRILAEISGDSTVLQLFAQGKDMHAETARAMFGLSADIDTRQHLHNGVAVRDIAKTINFGLIYGMGVQGLANRIGVSIEEAQKLIRAYFRAYQGIDKWLRQATQQTIENGYATTLAGRKRIFALASRNKAQRATLERSARNHPIQGTNADILKRALALLYEALPERVHLILCVHDEIVLECPEDLLEGAERILKQAMVQACRDFLKVVAIPEPVVVVGKAWIKK